MSELKQILDELRKPVNGLQWRLQSSGVVKGQNGKPDRGWALCVPYVDARTVQKRFNEVCPRWQSDYKDLGGQIYCGIGIYADGEWHWRWDTGSAGGIEPEKSLASDALKRAAVQWGFNHESYDMQPFAFNKVEQTGKTRDNKPIYSPVGDNGKVLKHGSQLTAYINKKIDRSATGQIKALIGTELEGIQTREDLEKFYKESIQPALSRKKASLNG